MCGNVMKAVIANALLASLHGDTLMIKRVEMDKQRDQPARRGRITDLTTEVGILQAGQQNTQEVIKHYNDKLAANINTNKMDQRNFQHESQMIEEVNRERHKLLEEKLKNNLQNLRDDTEVLRKHVENLQMETSVLRLLLKKLGESTFPSIGDWGKVQRGTEQKYLTWIQQ